MSQYGFYCYHSCQVWHWSIVCLSVDYIVIIVISCQVWHWSIVCLSMDSIVIIAVSSGEYCIQYDSIVIIAVRSGTGVLYVSVWIILLS